MRNVNNFLVAASLNNFPMNCKLLVAFDSVFPLRDFRLETAIPQIDRNYIISREYDFGSTNCANLVNRKFVK
jgi:hypothetical protein